MLLFSERNGNWLVFRTFHCPIVMINQVLYCFRSNKSYDTKSSLRKNYIFDFRKIIRTKIEDNILEKLRLYATSEILPSFEQFNFDNSNFSDG